MRRTTYIFQHMQRIRKSLKQTTALNVLFALNNKNKIKQEKTSKSILERRNSVTITLITAFIHSQQRAISGHKKICTKIMIAVMY